MDLLTLIIIVLISAATGNKLLTLFKFKFTGYWEEFLISAGLGLATVSYLVYCLGLLGLLYKINVIILFSLLTLICIKQLLNSLISFWAFIKSWKIRAYPLYFFAILSLVIFFTFTGANAPVTCNDSLAYRLSHVRIFLENHKLTYIPYTRESLWPYLIEMLFAAGILLKSDITAKLIAWSFGLLSGGLIYSFTKQNFSKRAGQLSVSIFLLTPAIFTQMTYSYVDIPMAAYSFLSLTCLIRFFQNYELKWAGLAGIFSGAVLSIKFMGIISTAIIAVLLLYKIIIKKERTIFIKALFIFLITVIIASFAWYLRSYLIKGNPVFPFFAKYFGNHGWQVSLENYIGSKLTFLNLILLPWNLVMYPDKFGGESVGLFYLLFLPLLLTRPKLPKLAKLLLIFSAFYTVLWFIIDPYIVRFYFPALLPLSIVLAVKIDNLFIEKSWFNLFLKIIIGFCFIFSCLLLFYHNADKLKVSFGMENKAKYLQKNERTFTISEFINGNTEISAKILIIGEVRNYYIKRSYIPFDNLVYEKYIDNSLLDKPELINKLRNFKPDYILVNFHSPIPMPIVKYLEKQTPLLRTSFIDKESQEYDYSFYKFQP